MVKTLAKAAFKSLTKGAAKEALPVIGKEVAEQTFKSFDVTAREAYGNLGRFDSFKTLADESKQSLSHHFDSLPSNEIRPESQAIESMFQKMDSTDPEIANIGFGEFNDVDHALRTVNHTSHEANKLTAKRDEISGKTPLSDSQNRFTVDQSLRSKGLEALPEEDLNWQWENVQNIWKDIDSRIAKGQAKATLKGKTFKPGDDLVSLQASLGPVNPKQVKGWVKTSMAKFKSGLKREVGGTVLNEKGIPEPEIEGMSYMELHHELMKKLYAAYIIKARQLFEAGAISKADVINFNHLANDKGFGMGDYGVKGYNRPTHSLGHTRAIEKAIQPSGKQLTESTDAISKLDNINDLTSDFIKSMNEVAEPMRRELDLSQRAYDAIPVEDQKKVILLYRIKDSLKLDLLQQVREYFNSIDLKIPAKKNGEELISVLNKKKIEIPEQILELQVRIEEARQAADSFLANVKSRITKQIDTDIQSDIQKGIARDRPGKGVGRSGLYPEQARLEDESYQQFQADDRFAEYTSD